MQKGEQAVRRLAILRMVLGTMQAFGALFAMVLVLGSGVNPLSLTAVAVTVVLMLASRIVFRNR